MVRVNSLISLNLRLLAFERAEFVLFYLEFRLKLDENWMEISKRTYSGINVC